MSTTEVNITLKTRQVEFLEQVTQQQGLADVSKAVRCLIDFAVTNPDELDRIFGEIRCLDC